MKKRVFSIFLCLTLLLGTVTLFASCKKTGADPVVDKKVLAVDLSAYTIVQDSELPADLKNQVADVATQLSAVTGIPFRPQIDQESAPVETAELEILIGKTNRVETEKAMKDAGKFGWVIRVFDNKIVIAGTSNFLTRVALAYFTDNYVNTTAVQGTVISLNKKVSVKNMGSLTLLEGSAEDAVGAFSVVHSQTLDATDGSVDFGTEPSGDTVDYPVTVSRGIRTELAKATDISANGFKIKTDADAVSVSEILVGNVDRPEMQAILATLGSDEYSVVAKDGKIFVAAWNDITLKRAYGLFQTMMKESTVTDENGNETVMLPARFEIKMAISGSWVTEFPRPQTEGVQLVTTQDVSDGSHLYVYGGEGVSLEAYRAYCDLLKSNKYVMYGPETSLEGSYFATYINYSAGINLRVSYFAYAHAEEQEVDNFVESIRIVANTTEKVSTPDTDYYNPKQAYVKLTDTMITSLKLDYKTGEFGMSYVITLEDGTFIVYDGGGISGGNTAQHTVLWNVLTDLYKQTHEGADPDSSNPIHIRAWILTHEHMDHYMILTKFCETYGKDSRLRFDMLLANFASDTECINVYNPESYVEANLEPLQSKVSDRDGDGKGFDYIKIHTGEIFYMANAKMEVLYTHEDIWPQHMAYFNNSSSIFRITLDSTNGKGVTEKSHSTIWLGDLERVGSKCLRAMYGETLDADHVQVAHHGWNGVESELYALIAPEVVWWPAAKDVYTSNALNANATAWYKQVDYFIANELPSVQIIIMSDGYYTTMKLTKEGSHYKEGELVDYTGTKQPTHDNVNIFYKGPANA